MAITNFIPTIWSENLLQNLDKQYIAVAHCSRDYEGEIREKGSTVKICGVGNVTVSNYTKNTNMDAPQTLSDSVRELVINQAKYFNFQLDDVDHAQATPGLMDLALKNAANALANQADRYVFSLGSEAAIQKQISVETGKEIINALLQTRTSLMKNNVMDPEDLIIEVTPEVAAVILKEKISLGSDNYAVLEKGCIGSLFGSKIYVSNNLPFSEDDSYNSSTCWMRTKRAVAFAEQLSEIEAYRPELRFADAVKGLHLYGAKVVYPLEMACVQFDIDHGITGEGV